ncbi:MAG TPA: hypothetical protein VFT32_12415, partial [Candidatus Eisenbacteria bacterium]|nr:hypothetical protein [Candidatus Eisenbacteria bacterium]
MPRRRTVALFLAACGLASWLVAAPAPAQTPKRAATQSAAALPVVASVEGITEYRLKNGMRVLLFPDPSKQTATVNITYLVGSR